MIQGGETEIDRRILEEMKDPLIHLVRNCIDHGIEIPSLRKQKEKPPRGRVVLSFAQKNSGQVEITISDDGAGVDIAKVKAAAVKHNILSNKERTDSTWVSQTAAEYSFQVMIRKTAFGRRFLICYAQSLMYSGKM